MLSLLGKPVSLRFMNDLTASSVSWINLFLNSKCKFIFFIKKSNFYSTIRP